MKKYIKLDKNSLTVDFENLPNFSTTEEVSPYKDIIGQKRAEQSIDLGLQMSKKEYNIFISGRSNTGKTSYIVKKIRDYAKELPSPKDWCYVYNFQNDKQPIAISLETGTANNFKDDMDKFIEEFLKKVPIFFNDQGYEREKNNIIRKYEKFSSEISNKLSSMAEERSFSVEQDAKGNFLFIPLKNGIKLQQEEYTHMSQEDKNLLEETLNELRLIAIEVDKELLKLNKQMGDELDELDTRIAESIIEDILDTLYSKYDSSKKIMDYLTSVKKDIIENLDQFFDDEDNNGTEKDLLKKVFLKRYKVNVIVSNCTGKGAPVIFEDSTEYSNIFGKIEYENIMGSVVTNFTMISPGSIDLANGGYLIINADKLLNNLDTWKALKRCLKTESIITENSKSSVEVVPMITLKPEDIPLNIKVILIGSDFAYSLFSSSDPEFKKFFKIKAEFDSQIENEGKNIANIIGFISNYVRKNNMFNVTKEGIIELLTYSCRLAGNKRYFTARMSEMLEVLDIAYVLAKKEKAVIIDRYHMKSAVLEIQNMHGLYRKKTLEMYKSKKYIISLNGLKVGQINGLSVIDYGDWVIGQQHKITVTTFAGKKGIVNIEREVEMSGSIHSKGIMILSGYIGELLAQNTPISFNASIVFEQLYSGIEGDSASAAELIALISSLSGIPIKQSMAITGSVNQKGEIQPIGGVNEKIEGYFDICSIWGLDGSHGVIIPYTNIDDLVLKDEVIEAVDKELFHIYAVSSIEDCMELLYDTSFKSEEYGEIMETVKQHILVKLQKYNFILNAQTDTNGNIFREK